jgi:hypothetical protein
MLAAEASPSKPITKLPPNWKLQPTLPPPRRPRCRAPPPACAEHAPNRLARPAQGRGRPTRLPSRLATTLGGAAPEAARRTDDHWGRCGPRGVRWIRARSNWSPACRAAYETRRSRPDRPHQCVPPGHQPRAPRPRPARLSGSRPLPSGRSAWRHLDTAGPGSAAVARCGGPAGDGPDHPGHAGDVPLPRPCRRGLPPTAARTRATRSPRRPSRS